MLGRAGARSRENGAGEGGRTAWRRETGKGRRRGSGGVSNSELGRVEGGTVPWMGTPGRLNLAP